MSFDEVCNECLSNDDFVDEFCRLKNIERPDKRSPIQIMIDRSCGYDPCREFITQFTEFCFYFIYLPIVAQ